MRPRIGLLGVGWIGRLRLQALVDADVSDVVALADPSAHARDAARAIVPPARVVESLDELLRERLDGVVIATPSALHAAQAMACLERGMAVFCQKPLACTAHEAAAVVGAARAANRRLDVDLCYRTTAAASALKRLVAEGVLGTIHSVELVFLNAYSPGQEWCYVRDLAGGGCVMDLGIHLLDQLVWLLGWRDLRIADARLLTRGVPWSATDAGSIEDFAQVIVENGDGAVARLTCAWRASIGQDARIGIELVGTTGGARLRNVGGSFYDFAAERFEGTRTTLLAAPPDEWGGRAIVEWARAIGEDPAWVEEAQEQVALTRMLDEIYATAGHAARLPSIAR